MRKKHTNALIHETSPYLIQHAHNPVNWVAWKPEVLEEAVREEKLLLISIGYAACHWCHVMEKECFEDEQVAQLMNTGFVNIKVDREERPDIDHIYMDALQMMTGSGGWPLNIIALPDGRPIWGTTYMDKGRWMQALRQLREIYSTNRERVVEYAQNLTEGIRQINLIQPGEAPSLISEERLEELVAKWSSYFDREMGGYRRAPKFMMPGNLDFLLHYGISTQKEAVLSYVNLTLQKMAYGGVYDQLGGGFSRYSVDTRWHVPHFEKMLYDNGLLVSLYAKAYAVTRDPLYKKVVEESIAFVERELMDESNGFYSSLDADSLNEFGILEEGAYYIWRKEQLQDLLGQEFELFRDFYNINDYGLWEDGKYVLIRDEEEETIAAKHGITPKELRRRIKKCRERLLKARATRERPRLDDKILTSWNGLMLIGLTDAYRYLQKKEYLILAEKNAEFLHSRMMNAEGKLFHNYKEGKRTVSGYLEDYATVALAYLRLYETSLEDKWLALSGKLLDYCLAHFFDPSSKLFFFTSDSGSDLIRRTLETQDNVIPASNSILANTLFKMGKYFPDRAYEKTALGMIRSMGETIQNNVEGHANWLHLERFINHPFYEIAVVGPEFRETAAKIRSHYLPNTVLAGSETEGTLQLLKNRAVEKKTLIYVCQQGSCQLPVTEITEVLSQVRNKSLD